MQFRFKTIGSLAGKTGWHECPASPTGRVLFTGGVCNVDLDEDAVEAMIAKRQFPYGAFYVVDPDAQQAKPSMKVHDILTTATRDEVIGELPPEGPLVTFVEATEKGPNGKSIISPVLLQKALRSGDVKSVSVGGEKRYSLEQIRAYTASQSENEKPKKGKK